MPCSDYEGCQDNFENCSNISELHASHKDLWSVVINVQMVFVGLDDTVEK